MTFYAILKLIINKLPKRKEKKKKEKKGTNKRERLMLGTYKMTHNLYHKDPPLHFYHLQLTTLVSSGTSCAILCVPNITQREMM